MKKNINFIGMALITSAFLAGCGSDSGSPIVAANNTTTNTGVFLDSAVEGLEYSTATQSGITDSNGTFKYLDGEEVEFRIGGITLGKVVGGSILSPLDLAGTNSPHNERVVETLRLLQSIDEDSNSSNGIKISNSIRTIANGMNEDLSGTFSVATTLVNLGVDVSKFVGIDEAVEHFKGTLNNSIKQPTDSSEFDIIKGVYQDDNTIMKINENGMISMYTYDSNNHCINNSASTDDGYDMDGLFVTHNSEEEQFLVDVNGDEYGWEYSNNTLGGVFGSAFSSATLNISTGGNKIFLTSNLSTEFTQNNLAENMCSVLGTSNKFKNIRGVYQNESYTDSNTTMQELVRATVIHIDANATIHTYKVDNENSCLAEVVSDDYNYDINSKILDIKDFEYTVDDNANIKQYFALDGSNNRFSWLETEDGVIKYVSYKVNDEVPSVSFTNINVRDLKIFLTPSKSTTYTEDNISSSLCK